MIFCLFGTNITKKLVLKLFELVYKLFFLVGQEEQRVKSPVRTECETRTRTSVKFKAGKILIQKLNNGE
ncbi:MAG: hypothetical protein EGQ00_15240 [Parabacteroides johnsonii]|nr:hypothetical protein [Parabacteroides johnsonii]